MTPEPSVTTWIEELKRGNHAAAQKLWQVYFHRLVGLAHRQRKLEGYTNAEIAGELGCLVRTVERRLRLIRNTWTREFAP